MPLRSGIEAIDRPTVLYILYSTISAQQTNLLPENASQNDAIFPKSRYGIYQTTSQWLRSYGCAIIVLYRMCILRMCHIYLHMKHTYVQFYMLSEEHGVIHLHQAGSLLVACRGTTRRPFCQAAQCRTSVGGQSVARCTLETTRGELQPSTCPR